MRCVHIVDDDDPCRALLRRQLSGDPDLIIRCYRTGEAFLAQNDELDPGVLLLDLRTQDPSGMRVLGAAKYASVALTGPGDVPLAVAAMQAGALDVLEKPCEPHRLMRTVAAAFARLDERHAAARRARDARAKISALSPREGDVLKGLMEGRPNKEIACHLALSPRTVEIHRANMMEKLSARSLPEAMRVAFAAGMFAVD